MRSTLFSVLVLLCFTIKAQNRYSHFVGGVEFATGYSSIIDFNRDNNIAFSRDLKAEQLFYLFPFIPYQFGIFSAKYLNRESCLEFGFFFHKCSVGWIRYYPQGWGIPGINLYSMDLPVKYYFPSSVSGNLAKAFVGIIPSRLFYAAIISDDEFTGSVKDYLKDGYVSVCGGLCWERGNRRFKIQTNLAFSSVVKDDYRKDFSREERAYGAVIFPFELLCGWTYIIR